jgi:microcystin-dependent protein
MAQGFYTWSQTAGSNATASAAVNWQEGQSPSSINDSARAMMAETAKYRDDTAGHTAAAGSASAYTFASSQVFTSTSDLNGQEITFIAPATNALGVTLNVDSVGAFPLVTAPATGVPAGSLIAGSVYTATFYSSVSEWRLRSFYVNPFNIPLAGGMDYWAPTVPNSNFAFPTGQAISRTTYAALFALIGTTYGVGDGTTTFNLPDKTGRISAMYEPGGSSRLTSTYFGGNSTALGATGGGESHALTTLEIPSHNHANTATSTDSGHTHTWNGDPAGGLEFAAAGNQGGPSQSNSTGVGFANITTTMTNAFTGGGNAHRTVQPTIVCNYILRII